MSLLELLRTQLKQKHRITFAEFMQQALYAPNLGYYSAGLQKIGSRGDFITAPELTPLFGKTLANQCREILVTMQEPIVFEFGAGSGRLCVDLLIALEQFNCLPKNYLILEVSGDLRQRQSALIQQEIPHLFERIEWIERWPAQQFTGVVIANEVLDAMPVHRFLQTKEGILESFIALDSQHNLVEVFEPSKNNPLLDYVKTILPVDWAPYQSEMNLHITDWIQQCYLMLKQGVVLLIDYGFPRHEYYHPDRNQGTLMCHYRHQAHTNPLLHIGEQDITAHVDFTHVAEAAVEAGFHVAGYTNQASFLLANGLLSLVDDSDKNSSDWFNAQQKIKQLIQPNEMGELFKVMALTKNTEIALTGFGWYDKRASL